MNIDPAHYLYTHHNMLKLVLSWTVANRQSKVVVLIMWCVCIYIYIASVHHHSNQLDSYRPTHSNACLYQLQQTHTHTRIIIVTCLTCNCSLVLIANLHMVALTLIGVRWIYGNSLHCFCVMLHIPCIILSIIIMHSQNHWQGNPVTLEMIIHHNAYAWLYYYWNVM